MSSVEKRHASTGPCVLFCKKNEKTLKDRLKKKESYTTTHCNTLQHTAAHCNTLQHTATHCNTILKSFSPGKIDVQTQHIKDTGGKWEKEKSQ